jgi:hypothetical protein
MEINFMVLLLATIIPLIVGFVWYNPKVFGTVWMKETGVTPESAKDANMALIFGLTALFSFLIAFMMQFLVIHQFSVASLLTQQPDFNSAGSEAPIMLEKFKELYWNSYRTFKHGAFHGTLAGLFLATPILGINALFENKRFKYIAISGGYFTVCMALMGGVICAFT